MHSARFIFGINAFLGQTRDDNLRCSKRYGFLVFFESIHGLYFAPRTPRGRRTILSCRERKMLKTGCNAKVEKTKKNRDLQTNDAAKLSIEANQSMKLPKTCRQIGDSARWLQTGSCQSFHKKGLKRLKTCAFGVSKEREYEK